MSIVQSRPRRAHGIAARLCILGLSLVSFASATESKDSSTAHERAQISECLTFTQEALETGVEYHFANGCKKTLACSFEWTLTCGEKAPFKQFHRRAAVPLAPKSEQSVTANVQVCKGDSWEITGAAWACSSA
jgi:hypothetical protein